jgi:hypothetical protein
VSRPPIRSVHLNINDLLHYSFLPFKRLRPSTPALVLGPLKLATKYQADRMRKHIISYLEKDWPTTLDDWDKLIYASEETSSDSVPHTDERGCCDTGLLPDPIPFISLARSCDCRRLLGTILYSLCPDAGLRRDKLSRMAPRDLMTLTLGAKSMMKFISRATNNELAIAVREEQFGYDCRARMCHVFVFKWWSAILVDIIFHGDPLTTIRTRVMNLRHNLKNRRDQEEWEIPTDMCHTCQERLADHLSKLRYKLFDELPSFFGSDAKELLF